MTTESATDSVLDMHGEHYTLAQQLDSVSETSHVPVSFLQTSMKQFCTAEEVAYVIRLRYHENAGMIYVGADNVTPRMMAVSGACIRNFLDARVMMLKEVLTHLKNGDMPNADVICVPNFCIGGSDKGVADWEVGHLVGWLYERLYNEQKTFLAITDFDHVEKRMGTLVSDFLKTKFIRAV